MMTFVFISLLGFHSFAGEGEKKTSNQLNGAVCDAANLESLAGAEVVLPELGLKTLCDMDGKFVIEGVPAGTYVVEVRYVSYKDARYAEVKVDEKGKFHKFVLESI